MANVFIYPTPEAGLLLREGRSELFISPKHVPQLGSLDDMESFKAYFMEEALCNRGARQLFKAFLRHDPFIFERLAQLVKPMKKIIDERENSPETKEDQCCDDPNHDHGTAHS